MCLTFLARRRGATERSPSEQRARRRLAIPIGRERGWHSRRWRPNGAGDAGPAAITQGDSLDWRQAAAYVRRARGERKRPRHGWDSLTPTEEQVVSLVTEGLTNPQIAERLYIGRTTVKTHLEHVFSKLGVRTRAELAGEASRRAHT